MLPLHVMTGLDFEQFAVQHVAVAEGKTIAGRVGGRRRRRYAKGQQAGQNHA
jgi:hypothetical protein